MSGTHSQRMTDPWLILHGGALGDLVLTLQFALRLPGVAERGLHLVTRVNPGDLSSCRPSIVRHSSETLGLHWLFSGSAQPPMILRDAVRGRLVLSALSGPHTIVHQRLCELEPATLYGFDPRPQPGLERHITQQWQTQLEAQGLLVPKCVHQRPGRRSLGVPEGLRARGRRVLAAAYATAPRLRSTDQDGDAPAAGGVLLHPGSGGRRKCWPLERFIAFGRKLRSNGIDPGRAAGRDGDEVAFLIGPVELEKWPRAEIDAIEAEFTVLCAPGPDDLVALLAAAAVVVGNDAGPTHLAALLGTPTVAIFGPTSPSVWKPLGSTVAVVRGTPGQESAAPWPDTDEVMTAVRAIGGRSHHAAHVSSLDV